MCSSKGKEKAFFKEYYYASKVKSGKPLLHSDKGFEEKEGKMGLQQMVGKKKNIILYTSI